MSRCIRYNRHRLSLRFVFYMRVLPAFVHSNWGLASMSRDQKNFLYSRGVVASWATSYHPSGISHCEWYPYNQTTLKTIRYCLKGKLVPEEQWEGVLVDVVHSIRSLYISQCNATNDLFSFSRRFASSRLLPACLATPPVKTSLCFWEDMLKQRQVTRYVMRSSLLKQRWRMRMSNSLTS